MAQAPRKAAPAAVAATPAKGERRVHPVLMNLHLDGVLFTPGGDPAPVTEAEFDVLKDASVFDGEWRDGKLEAGDAS